MRKIYLAFVAAVLLNVASGFSKGTVNYNVSGLQMGDKSVVSFGSERYLITKTLSANGDYFFGNIPKGSYFIKIEANGYNLPNAQTVIVNEDGSIYPSVGINLVISKISVDSTVWTHSWSEDVSNSGYTTTSNVNNPPTIEFLGKRLVPSDVPFTGILQNIYNIYLSDEEETWTQEYAYRLVETLKTIPFLADEKSKFVLTKEHLFEDISIIKYGDTAKTVQISLDCFSYANPFMVNLDGVRGRFFSKRLHHALVNFATDFGHNQGRVNYILSDRFGCTTDVSNYSALTAGITNEDAGRFQPFNPEELVSIINMFEELPEGFHKAPHLNYLIRRMNGTLHPLYPNAAAVAWPVDNGYIEFMETAFSGDANGVETLRLILHEKTHFLWKYSIPEEIKNDWITLGGWYPDPNSSSGWSTTKDVEFVSAYAHSKNPDEDMAESVANYLKNPELLQSRSISKYEFIRDRIMHGTRYISKIPDYLSFEVINLYPDYDYPGKIKRLDLKMEGLPNEDKVLTVEIELNHIEGFQDGASSAYTRVTSPGFVDVNGKTGMQMLDLQFTPVNDNPFVLRSTTNISKYAKSGYWTAGDIVVTDIQNNQRFEGRNDYVWNMYLNNPLEDLEPPKYESGSLNYELTDTIADGHSAKNLRITYKVTDNIGVVSTMIRLVRDDGTHSFGDMYGRYNHVTKIATIDFLITEYMPSDYYYVSSVYFRDYAGNYQSNTFSDFQYDQPIKKIYIETANPDTVAPDVDLNRITVYAQPKHPDNPDGETLVTINYYARDNKSGLGHVRYALKDPQGIIHYMYHCHQNFFTTYFEGNPTVWKKYTINLVLPQGSAQGIWGLSEIELIDKVWNRRIYNFVETMIFEPDNSSTNYVLFTEMPDNNTVNLKIKSDTICFFGFNYRIINEETGEEISGEIINEESQQSKSLLRSYSSSTTQSKAVDVSNLSAGKLIVVVQIKNENGEVVAVRSGTVFKNAVPVANAGPDQVVNEGETVILDGSLSTDADSNPLTYKWEAPTGITLSSTTVAKPTFVAPEVAADTQFTFSLVVNDGAIDSPADQVVITVKQVNKVPVANAGSDQTVNEGETVTLDGSASSDGDGNNLTYLWTAPAGITLSSTTVTKPTFTAPEVTADTQFTLSLVVNDGFVDSPADQVIITVKQVNKAPIANAGSDQIVNEGSDVTLDGSASSDGDGDAITYLWTVPTGITLSSTTVAKPTFTAPEVTADTQFILSLVVNDGTANSFVDQVVVTVKQVNKAPVANAGPDQELYENETVTLNGAASSDPDSDVLTYLWTAPEGIVLSSTTASNPTFVAPSVTSDTKFTFNLVVNDGNLNSAVDQVVITVKNLNSGPVANAGADQTVNEGVTVTLDGSASSDPDGNPLTYKWTAPAGITLSSTTDAKPTFITPDVSADTDFIFTLVVNDGIIDSQPDEVVVKVKFVVGLQSIKDADVEIYPNPVKDLVNIKFDREPMVGTQISVYDFTGKAVIKSVASGKDINLDLSSVQVGPYFIKIGNQTYKTYKIIKY